MNRTWIALIGLLACGCQGRVAPAPQQEESRLMQGCGETDRLLGQMKATEPTFTYDRSGNATISKPLWEAMPRSMQDGLIKAIAYQAICAAREPGEQEVIVRNSGTSEILAQRTVTEFNR